jgi:S1-C subfamily serine protease
MITAPISAGSSVVRWWNMQGEVIRHRDVAITGGQSVNFAIPSERISQLQTTTPMTLTSWLAAWVKQTR